MSKARSLADLISGGATIEASEIADSTITGGKLASDITINTTGTVTTTKISGPSYTNLTNYSEEFDNSFWVKSRASISANAIIAPNGTTTADSLIESTDNNNTHYVNKSISSMVTLADGDKITLSVYAKAGTRDHLFLSFNWGSYQAVSIFDLSDGAISNTSSNHDNVVMEDVGEGWYRCSITDTHDTNSPADTFRCDIGIASGDTTFSYTGDGSSNIYIWGASFSVSDRPISYIKTVTSSEAETEAYVETRNFNVNSGALYIDTVNRKIGRGTSTPSSTLDVNGNLTLSGNIIDSQNNDVIEIEQNDIRFLNKHVVAGYGVGMRGNRGSTLGMDYSSALGTSSLALNTNGTQRITISSGGDISFYEDTGTTAKLYWDASTEKLGIGTTSPLAQLHITGSDTTDQVIIENTDAGSGSAPDLVMYRNSASPAVNDILGRIDFRGKNDGGTSIDYGTIYTILDDETAGTEDGSLWFQIERSGGTVVPLKLKSTEIIVNDNGVDTDFRVESVNNTNMLHVNAGNDRVGIGGIPTERLSVIGPNNTSPSTLKVKDTDSRGILIESPYSGSGVGFIGTDGTSSALGFKVNSTEYMRIDTSGRLGIGTITPSTTLDIQPSLANSGIRVRRHNASDQYIEISETDGSRHEIKANGTKEFRIVNTSTESGQGFNFYRNGAERLRILGDGLITFQDSAGTVAFTSDLYTNSDVDAHLNQLNPTSGYVLSWNGSDYAWVAQSGGAQLDGTTEITGTITPGTDSTYALGSSSKKFSAVYST